MTHIPEDQIATGHLVQSPGEVRVATAEEEAASFMRSWHEEKAARLNAEAERDEFAQASWGEAEFNRDLVAVLRRLEDACQRRAELTTDDLYGSSLRIPRMMDALDELDDARRVARDTLERAGQVEPPSELSDLKRQLAGTVTEEMVRAFADEYWGQMAWEEDDLPNIRAALEAARVSGTVQTWQPIETAPKDGTTIDLWGFWPEKHEWRRSADARWQQEVTGRWGWLVGGFFDWQYANPPRFTHWSHVPAAPSTDAKEG